MNANFPLGVILLDYTLGAAMWTLIGRFGMSIFLPDQSSFFFMRMFVHLKPGRDCSCPGFFDAVI